MKKKRRTKKANSRAHFSKRTQERFLVAMNRDQQREIVNKIQDNKAEFYDRQSLRVTRWVVEINGKKAIVVYDAKRKVLVTAMPLEWRETDVPTSTTIQD